MKKNYFSLFITAIVLIVLLFFGLWMVWLVFNKDRPLYDLLKPEDYEKLRQEVDVFYHPPAEPGKDKG